jgi:hypothetical protein
MKTPSISREARQRIAVRANEIRSFRPMKWVRGTDTDPFPGIYEPFTPGESRTIAKTIDALADFWQTHPNLWVRGNEFVKRQGVWKMCNVGVLSAAAGSYDNYVPFGDLKHSESIALGQPLKAVTFTMAYEGFLIEMNDNSRTVEENIAGLRITADVLRAFAELPKSKRADAGEWIKLVDAAFAKNLKLLKVQSQRYLKVHPRATAWKQKMNYLTELENA